MLDDYLMPDSPPSLDPVLAVNLCHEFDNNWSQTEESEIASFLERVPEPCRLELFCMLLEIENERRGQMDQTIVPEDYRFLGDEFVKVAVVVADGESNLLDSLTQDQSLSKTAESRNHSEKIGPYRLLEKLGEGGMGSVWLAQQEEPVERRVALKLIRSDIGSHDIIGRFEAERQALSMMDHPNIAKVLDAGTTEQGYPFFVMELIVGVPFTRYCDERKLTVRERLKLFVPVCKAVQHAHQKGIIHRDLKPSNVLVTIYDGEPVPKVIDFGLAKALEKSTRLTDKTLFTAFGKVVGTIQYMSPEQAEMNELDIDTRTDIYSLGVMLYELLTGSTPVDPESLANKGLVKLLEIIRDSDPPRPSQRLSSSSHQSIDVSGLRQITPNKLQQALRGELDWVVMKAIEKDRNRRYETANDLAQDLQHCLNDEPVQARPPSSLYRLKKFARKNKALVGSVVSIVTILTIAVGISSWYAYRANVASADSLTQKKIADSKSIESHNRLIRILVNNGANLLDEGDFLKSLPWFTAALKEELGDPEKESLHRVRLSTVLRNAPRLKRIWHFDRHMQVRFAEFSPDGSKVVVAVGNTYGRSGDVRIFDAETGKSLTPSLSDRKCFQARFSPNGNALVVGTDCEARIWNAGTGEPITPPIELGEEIDFVQFGADGKLVLTMNFKNQLSRVWDAKTGEPVAEPIKIRASSVDFSPDGTCMVIGGWGKARILDALNGEPVTPDLEHSFKRMRGGGTNGTVKHVAFSNNGKLVVTASADETARIWNAATGLPLTPPMQHTDDINFASFSPDDSLLATASDDTTVRVWNVETGELVTDPIRHSGSVTHVWFSPDQRSLATISGRTPQQNRVDLTLGYQIVRVWDATTGLPLTSPMRHAGRVNWLSFSPDSRSLLTASADRTARLWELVEQPKTEIDFAKNSGTGAISSSATQAVTLRWDDYDGHVQAWNVQTHQSTDISGFKLSLLEFASFSPDGSRLLVLDAKEPGERPVPINDGMVRPDFDTFNKGRELRIYDVRTGQVLSKLLNKRGKFVHASFSSDGQQVVTASDDGTARVWEVHSGKKISRPISHADKLNFVAFSSDSERIVTVNTGGAGNDQVRVWNVENGQRVSPPIPLRFYAKHATFGPGGKQLLIVGERGGAGLWDIRSGKPTSPIIQYKGNLLDVTYCDKDCWIIVSEPERSARVWNVTTGVPISPLLLHEGQVNAGVFSPDQRFVATISLDGTARIWNAKTGAPISPQLRHGPSVSGLYFDRRNYLPQIAFSSDSRRLIALCRNGIYSWNLEPITDSVEDLILQSQILSGFSLDESGAILPLDSDAIIKAWEKLSK